MTDKTSIEYAPSKGNPQLLEQNGRIFVNEDFVNAARNLFPATSLRIPLGFRIATDMTGKGLVYFIRHADFSNLDGYAYEVTYEPEFPHAWKEAILPKVDFENVPPPRERLARVASSIEDSWAALDTQLKSASRDDLKDADPIPGTALFVTKEPSQSPFRGQKPQFKILNRFGGVLGGHPTREGAIEIAKKEMSKAAAVVPGGLYGYTKGIQKMCEAASRKLHRSASKIIRASLSKDKDVVDFLATHAKRAKSTPAKLLVATYRESMPKLATLGTHTDAPVIMSQIQEHFLRFENQMRPETLSRIASDLAAHHGEDTVNLLLKKMFANDILQKRGSHLSWNPSKRMASLKAARTYGMYGYLQRTANHGMSACVRLREEAGIIAADLHQRKSDLYEKITGFLGAHSKTGRDNSARLLLSVYPDAQFFGKRASSIVEEPSTIEEWLAWEPEP